MSKDDRIKELHSIAQRVAAAGETGEPVTVSLAGKGIERLQAELDRLCGAHSFPHVSRIGKHLTLVFDADELSNDEKHSLFERARAMSWSHAIDDRKAAEKERDQLQAEVERLQLQLAACG